MTARPRRGAALAIALFALVTIAALAHAVLAPSVASRRASRRTTAHHLAESAAEAAIAGIIGGWPTDRWQAIEVGGTVLATARASTGDPPLIVNTESRVLRLDGSVFAVSVLAGAAQPDVPVAARRSVLVELRADVPDPAPALTAGGHVRLAADTEIATADSCEGDPPESPQIVVAPASDVTAGGLALDEGALVRDPRAGEAATYARPAGFDVTRLTELAGVALASGASVTPSPAEAAGECAPGPANWGGGTGACASHRPVIVAGGDLRIRGGEGQGILIVDGRLVIEGPFRYTGLIVATGELVTAGGPVSLTGAVFVGPDGDVTVGEGPAVIRASRCALAAASEAWPRLRVVPERGWWR